MVIYDAVYEYEVQVKKGGLILGGGFGDTYIGPDLDLAYKNLKNSVILKQVHKDKRKYVVKIKKYITKWIDGKFEEIVHSSEYDKSRSK